MKGCPSGKIVLMISSASVSAVKLEARRASVDTLREMEVREIGDLVNRLPLIASFDCLFDCL